jgi:hypothetical protein
MLFTFISLATLCFGQNQRLNAIELTADIGISHDLGETAKYKTFTFFEDLVVEGRTIARTRNWSLNYTRLLNPKNGVKISFGQTQFGFDYEGKLQNTGTPLRGFFQLTNLEFGLSYLRKIFQSNGVALLVEPGIRYHSDASPRSNAIIISGQDAFSLSVYTGLEFPMVGDNFFTNLGLQIKLPLQRYNIDRGTDTPYYPYFIGIKIGVNFQFSWTSENPVKIF